MDFPQIPTLDEDFTPDLARKIIELYQGEINRMVRVDTRQVGPFKAVRVFAPDSIKHATLFTIKGRFWFQTPKWVLRRWWPEESMK